MIMQSSRRYTSSWSVTQRFQFNKGLQDAGTKETKEWEEPEASQTYDSLKNYFGNLRITHLEVRQDTSSVFEQFRQQTIRSIFAMLFGEEKAKEIGVKPMATFVAGALAGVRPEVMGIGPVASTKKVMAKTGMKIEDFDIIEANEAFAAQSVAVGKDLGIDVDKQLTPNGGAIALGHPVGASGARILVTLLHEMQAKGAKTGLATLCIGGGMGCSTIVKIED